jgi:branched-chain amino acid transport system substrate-binding protein
MLHKSCAALLSVGALLSASPSVAADSVKLGFITTLTGPGASIGRHQQDAVNLALEQAGSKIGGVPAEVIFVDDQQKPEIGKQVADQLIKKDKVDFVAGVIWSNVMLAVYNPIIRSETIFVGANAGPTNIAGADCSPYFFSASLINDQPPEALGQYMSDQKIDNVFVLMPNYSAGREDAEGFKRRYKGKIAGESYFPLTQQDFAAELTQIKNANPSAVMVFAPGGLGIQFIKQYEQAGLKDKIPLYSIYTSDEVTLPAQREAARGNYEARHWNYDLDVPANKDFVDSFRKKYNYTPSFYAAQAFDAVKLLDSGVAAVKGKIEDKSSLIAALAKAEFKSVRGELSFNTNHFPIQDFHLVQVVEDGGQFVTKRKGTIFKSVKDTYAEKCAMKTK